LNTMFARTKPIVRPYRRQPNKPAPVLVVQQARDGFEFLLAKPHRLGWEIEDFGVWSSGGLAPSNADEQTDDSDSGLAGESIAGPGSPDQTSAEKSGVADPSAAAEPGDPWTQFLRDGCDALTADGTIIAGRRLILNVRRPVIEFLATQIPEIQGLDLTEAVQNHLTVQERIDVEQWTIDYASYAPDPHGQRRTFVASLPTTLIQDWDAAARAQKLKLTAIHVRPWSTVQWIAVQQKVGMTPTLVVSLQDRQVDLMVWCEQSPIFIRSFQLHHADDPESVSQQLLSEIRLTAGTVDLPDDQQVVTQAVIVADPEWGDAIADGLQQNLELETLQLRPLQDASFVFGPEDDPPATLVPLLGSLTGFVATPTVETIDLFNPKTIAKPVSRLRIYGWLTAVIMAGLGFWGFDLWQTYQDAQSKLSADTAKHKQALEAYNRIVPRARLVDYLQSWDTQQVNWLQQLEAITERLPSGDQVVVKQYDGKRTATGADISMQIQARDLEAIAEIDQAIRESGWRLQFRRVVETQDPVYPFRLESTLSYTQE
jgi:hypothetical protein